MGQKPADIPEDALRQLYYEEQMSQKEIADQLGCSQAAVWRRMRKHGMVARSKSVAALLKSPYRSLRRDFDDHLYTKAYLIGFCKGDVHVWIRDENSETIRLMSSTTKPEQVELFQRLFASYGRVYISELDQRGAVHMGAYVNMSMAFLLDREDAIPDWILADQETFFAFFAGYVDAEAHIGVHGDYAVFKLDSCDKNILFQSHEMLCQAGISVPTPSICAPQGYSNKHGHRYRDDMWRLKVGSKSSLLLLFERISPYLKHTGRIRDMEAAIKNIEDRDAEKQEIHD